MIRSLSLAAVAALTVSIASAQAVPTGNVIFLHPDGTGANQWGAARIYWKGPDSNLNWDLLPHMAIYRGHMKDVIAGTSNGGATTHAFGFKVEGLGSFGKDGDGSRNPPTDRFMNALSGYRGSLMRQAANAGHPVGVVNDGHIGEPGTGCFLAEVGNRNDWDAISLQILKGRDPKTHKLAKPDRPAHVILGGGEENFLPEGERGIHGPGKRKDRRNLVLEAVRDGYTVIRTRMEFNTLFARLQQEPNYAPKVLGLFASSHTFNDRDEEDLIAMGMRDPRIGEFDPRSNLILWGGKPGTASANPPTFAEMNEMALMILERAAKRAKKGFFLVSEPESCDNFGNSGNAIGTLNALRRADDAIGVMAKFVRRNPKTLVLTAADSDANGMQVMTVRATADGSIPNVRTTPGNPAAGLPAVDVPLDGLYGRGTRAFVAAPDQFGLRKTFAIAWAADADVSGGIVSRAMGLNAGMLNSRFSGRFDNVDVYRLCHATLFGRLLSYPQGKQAPDRK